MIIIDTSRLDCQLLCETLNNNSVCFHLYSLLPVEISRQLLNRVETKAQKDEKQKQKQIFTNKLNCRKSSN